MNANGDKYGSTKLCKIITFKIDDDELQLQFRRLAGILYGGRKDAIGMAIREAMRQFLKNNREALEKLEEYASATTTKEAQKVEEVAEVAKAKAKPPPEEIFDDVEEIF